MWLYCIPHAIFHLMRWYPRDNRLKIRVIVIVCVLCTLAPELYIFLLDRSTRYCSVPLFHLLSASIAFTGCMIGFSILFALMDPVPVEVKLIFHMFGGITFVYSIVTTVYSVQASECKTYSAELYWFSYITSLLSMICIGFFVVTVPFWIINKLVKNSVLDEEYRTGLCYEVKACCQCVWHV